MKYVHLIYIQNLEHCLFPPCQFFCHSYHPIQLLHKYISIVSFYYICSPFITVYNWIHYMYNTSTHYIWYRLPLYAKSEYLYLPHLQIHFPVHLQYIYTMHYHIYKCMLQYKIPVALTLTQNSVAVPVHPHSLHHHHPLKPSKMKWVLWITERGAVVVWSAC